MIVCKLDSKTNNENYKLSSLPRFISIMIIGDLKVDIQGLPQKKGEVASRHIQMPLMVSNKKVEENSQVSNPI